MEEIEKFNKEIEQIRKGFGEVIDQQTAAVDLLVGEMDNLLYIFEAGATRLEKGGIDNTVAFFEETKEALAERVLSMKLRQSPHAPINISKALGLED